MPYITTAITYPNAKPHIGHCLEYVQADFLARTARLKGEKTFLLTGVDEHGLKIQQTALNEGLSPDAFVNAKAGVFKDLHSQLNISYDRFIRTTDTDHIQVAQAVWKLCLDKGDIYKKHYRAWYDIKEEEFLGLVDEYPDPKVFGVEDRFIEQIDEENYFFALSKYQAQVVEFIKQGYIIPDERSREILNFIEQKGIRDISISRDVSKLAWGIPVPGDESQVMYVWFDALVNYLTPAAKPIEYGIECNPKLWPADLHCVGKDISRFHAIIWPAMLMSAGIPLPKNLLVHGFITSGGQKMSKSLGNVVDPVPLLEKYGADPVRWFLLKEISTTGDGDCTYDRIKEVYESDLANDFGNLVSRVQAMCLKYCEGSVPSREPLGVFSEEAKKTDYDYKEALSSYAIHNALAVASRYVVFLNQQVEENKPWVLAKDPDKKEELERLMASLLFGISSACSWYEAAMPASVEKVKTSLLGETVQAERVVLFPKFDE